jgi:glycine cleavage system H lipoate-binding protein
MGTAKKQKSLKIVPAGKKKCIWMDAGLVSYKLCDNNYDCSTCAYDHALQAKTVKQKKAAVLNLNTPVSEKFSTTWVDEMMKMPASMRKCRYMITGEIGRKLCPNAYECGSCNFDQMMQERIHMEVLPATIHTEASGFAIADDFYYHEGHTWARPEYGGCVRIGFDDFAQKLLGPISNISLPKIGQEVKQGEISFHIKKNGQAASALSPIDGIVIKTNDWVIDNCNIINDSPFENGWLYIIEPVKLKKNLKGLYYSKEAVNFLSQEKDKLFSIMADGLAIAADGGSPVENISGVLGEENWDKLIKTFLKS